MMELDGSPVAPWGRFDDLRAGEALLFAAPRRVLAARSLDEVLPVLEAVDEASRGGGWAFGYVAYEAAPAFDPVLRVRPPAPGDPPLAWFGLTEAPSQVPPVAPQPGPRRYAAAGWREDWTVEDHAARVRTLRGHIAAGETYQANLTGRLRSQVSGDLRGLYADLALNQRARYGAYLDLGPHVIVSASPELFFSWSGRRLLTRPMKGTARRGRTPEEDEDLRRQLLTSPKERAENVIVVDLLRNDVSRLAVPGEVEVPVMCRAERYETVWQLTSDVTATVRPEVALVDVFRALFPCGSVTGAPKPRTMELLAALEGSPRGVYCGAIGIVGPADGSLRARFAVPIRTAIVDRADGAAVYGTGSGITWGSQPAREAEELQVKAAILTQPYEEFALLETLASLPGRGPRHLDRHLERLSRSAAYFGFPFERHEAARRVQRAVDVRTAARVRLVLARDGTLDVQLSTLPAPGQDPVRLVVDDQPIDPEQRWLYHKTTRRTVYQERTGRHPGADDVVLINNRGQVTETTVANIAARLEGVWCTPPVTVGCLPGVERGRLLELGRLHERVLTPADLHRADALALVSSLRGWRPAVLRCPGGCSGQG